MAHSSSASSTPRILVEATLHTICSFYSPETPGLRVTLTLEAISAVTVVTRNEAFWPVQNALVIVDASTEFPVILPRVDANYRSAAPLELNQIQKTITLLPGVPHIIVQSFRPFGPEIFDAVKKYFQMDVWY